MNSAGADCIVSHDKDEAGATNIHMMPGLSRSVWLLSACLWRQVALLWRKKDLGQTSAIPSGLSRQQICCHWCLRQ
eukprot:scaffold52691_cov17-Prasinocladus_malaysianus.AAC.1